MYCKKCGCKLKDGAKFCGNCGTPVTERTERAEIPIRPEPPRKPEHEKKVPEKSRGKWLKGVAVVLAVAAVICLAVYVTIGINLSTVSYLDAEKGTALTDEEAESILVGDISDEDWEAFESSNASICEIVSNYSNEDGYIDEDNVQSVVNEVAGCVNGLYEKGTVSYYTVTDEDVYFEYASGLGAYYTPAIEGYMAGGEDLSLTALSIDPFSDGQAGWAGGHAYSKGTLIRDNLNASSVNDYSQMSVTAKNYGTAEVGIARLLQLPECNFLLWQGHGGSTDEHLFLVTRTEATGKALKKEVSDTSLSVKDIKASLIKSEEDGSYYWAITASFIEKYIAVENGLVYLSACKSGYTDELADAFMSKGAEVVFVNTDTVDCGYTSSMMSYIIDYMSGDVDGVYYTASEALMMGESAFNEWIVGQGGFTDKDGNYYSDLQDYIAQVNENGAHVEIRGDGKYTLVNSILTSIAFNDDYSAEEQNEILQNLSVRLTAEDGTYKDYAPDEVNFFINKMDAGTYTVTLYEGETEIDEQTVEVESHHRAEVTLYYSALVTLEGYVYDTDGAPLSGVTVSAEDATGGSDLRSAETQTDDNGYYALKVYGENTYALTYSKSGYTGQETTFQITPELFEQAQEGTPCTLEDVELTADTWLLTSLVQTDPDGAEVYRLTLTYDSEGSLQTQKQTWENGGEYAYTFSYAEGSDLIESCTLDILVKDEDGTYDSYDLYGEYFYDGKDMSVWWLNRDGDGWGREISIYDSTGEIVEELLFDGFGGYIIINATCDDYGKVLRYDVVYILEYYTGPYYAYSYEYNEQGDWIVKTKYDEDGNLLQTQTASYTYDENGNKAVGAFYKDGKISSYVTYTYSKS